MKSPRPRLYLASPLFSDAERRYNLDLRTTLLSVVDVHLPQEDGRLLVDLVTAGVDVDEAKRMIYVGDLAAIEASDILLLVMDGRSVDEGASFELGYARARGKVCLGLKTDPRSLLPIGDNPMIECALDARFDSRAGLLAWIKAWMRGAREGRIATRVGETTDRA